ncbi:hypothetical protein GA0070606_0331 [Micromonospora citrea]|uniref:Uncharacterized protein n=1 Tax=Micromonospora citrea TaxID=47855 RepID=A0A1C6TRU2_9ACTN|nr:hypothetical protein GA0070606_0331 [Micromonospora citrea]
MGVPGRLAAFLLGATGAMGYNLLSTTVGYRGVAVTLAVGAVLAAANWVRGLPPRAPLVRYALRVLLALALVAAVVAMTTPRGFAGPAVLLSAGLVAAAVVIPADLVVAGLLAFLTAFAGLGLAFVDVGLAEMRDGDASFGAALVAAGVLLGLQVLRAGRSSVTAGGPARSPERSGAPEGGIRAHRLGQGRAGQVTGRTDEWVFRGTHLASTIGGVVFIGGGTAVLVRDGATFGLVIAAFGLGLVACGLAQLLGSVTLWGVAAVSAGAAFAGTGLGALRDDQVVAGAGMIGVGLVLVPAGGLMILHQVGVDRVLRWLGRLTSEPAATPGTGAAAAGRGPSDGIDRRPGTRTP